MALPGFWHQKKSWSLVQLIRLVGKLNLCARTVRRFALTPDAKRYHRFLFKEKISKSFLPSNGNHLTHVTASYSIIKRVSAASGPTCQWSFLSHPATSPQRPKTARQKQSSMWRPPASSSFEKLPFPTKNNSPPKQIRNPIPCPLPPVPPPPPLPDPSVSGRAGGGPQGCSTHTRSSRGRARWARCGSPPTSSARSRSRRLRASTFPPTQVRQPRPFLAQRRVFFLLSSAGRRKQDLFSPPIVPLVRDSL